MLGMADGRNTGNNFIAVLQCTPISSQTEKQFGRYSLKNADLGKIWVAIPTVTT